jgi:UDPglucose 6-dehydrogenase
VVVGASAVARSRLEPMLQKITPKLQWLSPASAEMSKHAINAFLATSVVFANELATLCEEVGADAKEVEAALKSEERIGPKAYVSPGGAFAGGTLARDIAFLNQLAGKTGRSVPLFNAVPESNRRHKSWALDRVRQSLGGLSGKRVGVLGLTYKPQTDTLRRSSSVELCRALAAEGATVAAYDPAISSLPAELNFITLAQSALELGALDALVVMTGWPQFKELDFPTLIGGMQQKVVVDPSRFLFAPLQPISGLRYFTIGKAS